MEDFKLSKRLMMVASLIQRGNTVADIGTDHGYLPIYIVKNGISDKVIGMDLRKGPLEKAAANVKEHMAADQIELRLSDGLEKLESQEASTITICGMGGKLIQNILMRGIDRISQDTQLIVSPQSEIPEFRKFLASEGFEVKAEYMLKEEGQYYLIIDCRYTESPADTLECSDGSQELQEETFFRYGKSLLERRDACLREYLERELELNQKVYDKVNLVSDKSTVVSRLEQLEYDRQCIECAMLFYR